MSEQPPRLAKGPRPLPPPTPQQLKAYQMMVEDGAHWSAVAGRFGISKQTVHRWVSRVRETMPTR